MDGPKLPKAEAARRSTAWSQPAIFRENDRRSKNWNTEKNRCNKTDKDWPNFRRVHLPLGNGTNETEVAIAGARMHYPMRGVTDGKQPGKKQ